MEDRIILIALPILIVISPFVSQIIKVPIAAVEILFGSIFGYFGLLNENEFFYFLSKIGFLFLMFLVGMEIDLKRFALSEKRFLKRTILYFLILYFLSFVLCAFFELNIVYFILFPIFSLGMLMILLKEYGKNHKWLALALSIGMVGELVSILALTILSRSLQGVFGFEFIEEIVLLFFILMFFYFLFKVTKILFWWFPTLKTSIMPHDDMKEQDIRFSISLAIMMVGLMVYLHIDLVLGAFLSGIFISTFFSHKVGLHEKLSSLGFGFFVPVFFIYVGFTLPLEAFSNYQTMMHALFVIVITVLIRILTSLVSFLGYLNLKDTILFALSTSMPLTFTVAVATAGFQAEAITQEQYYAFIIAGIVGSIGIMVVIKMIYLHFAKL